MSRKGNIQKSPILSVAIDIEADEPEFVKNSCLESNGLTDVVVCSKITQTCEVCATQKPVEAFLRFDACGHTFCADCVKKNFNYNISESKVDLQCLGCAKQASQEEIQFVLDEEIHQKYLDFALRQYLVRKSNVVFCPAPDCSFACINTHSSKSKHAKPESRKVSENHFVCQREGCGYEQCLKCKEKWHGSEPCQETIQEKTLNTKPCPTCSVRIEKMQDGSCNQMTCTVCRSSFCWLCGQRVSEMHFLGPSGCPLFGAQMWSSRKRFCCKVWLLMAAPLFIFLISFLSFPAALITFPIIISYLAYNARPSLRKCVRVFLGVLTAIIAILVSPLVALVIAILAFPFGCIYFYICIPVT